MLEAVCGLRLRMQAEPLARRLVSLGGGRRVLDNVGGDLSTFWLKLLTARAELTLLREREFVSEASTLLLKVITLSLEDF